MGQVGRPRGAKSRVQGVQKKPPGSGRKPGTKDKHPRHRRRTAPPSATLPVRLTVGHIEEVRAAATKEGLSLREYVERALGLRADRVPELGNLSIIRWLSLTSARVLVLSEPGGTDPSGFARLRPIDHRWACAGMQAVGEGASPAEAVRAWAVQLAALRSAQGAA